MIEPTLQLQYVPQFFVKQRITMMVNRYEIVEVNPDGSEGRLFAVAQQKRMAMREQVTFFSDDSRSVPLFGFRARQAIDLAASYDVTSADGTLLGSFQKDFANSLLRSSFHLRGPGFEAYGQERNAALALVRRFIDLPLPLHFDFTDRATGTPVLTSERQFSLRDRYTVSVPDQRIDFRLAASMAVGLDALMQR
ncbi:hypothetical protein [Mycetocola zhadangensis]|uniref:Uncharacterized protein n=1 Tax=Mycetocola zhadangensis TaxID=1164595 RepID=A0A3L7J192_9MICO|nr:hypothetical protein [Mycetocola zhadangensis]RLQ84204.1 hypothetical protein D9V28_08270 [Mycetocola zhadangensis]GGE95197.1 hypothetical protein GCM10011313_17700 [Mycetocola zhadangensis]